MAEVRKRNTKAPSTSSASSAQAQAPAPAQSNNALYIYIALAGLVTLAVYYFGSSGSASPSTSSNGKLQLTDDQLASYTGADPEKPIYIALNGTIFDVSEGSSFYGPGGHYGHFAGRDATRAWVSECFQPEYLTWDMKGVEMMFMPKWMDEEMEDAAAGESAELIPDAVKAQASALVAKFGKVSKKERRERREEDAEQVRVKIEEALSHWVNFFRNNPKYKEVGEVVGRKPLPEDREEIGLCADALKKRPVKGGKFEKLLGQAMGMGMNGQGDDKAEKRPDFVRGS